MPLESGTTIAELNPAWPLGSDPKSQGDDHLRLIKAIVQGDALSLDGGGTVTGAVDFTGSVTVNALDVTGSFTVSALDVTGTATVSALDVTGSATVQQLYGGSNDAAIEDDIILSGNAAISAGSRLDLVGSRDTDTTAIVRIMDAQVSGQGNNGNAVVATFADTYIEVNQEFRSLAGAKMAGLNDFGDGNTTGPLRVIVNGSAGEVGRINFLASNAVDVIGYIGLTSSTDRRFQIQIDGSNVGLFENPASSGLNNSVSVVTRDRGDARYGNQTTRFNVNNSSYRQGAFLHCYGKNSTSSTGWRTVNFDQAFASTPTVVATVDNGTGGDARIASVRNITTTSCQVRAYDPINNNYSTLPVMYHAMGEG